MQLERFVFWRDGHPWFILTHPLPAKGQVLCVNFTTLDDACTDEECILEPGEFGWIRHATVVAFSFARLWDLEKIIMALKQGILKPCKPPHLPESTFAKIREAAKKSAQLSRELKNKL